MDVRNLIINYIPTPIRDAELRQIFAEFGEIESARVIVDRMTNHPKGYGFVVFKRTDCALRAMEALNGFEILHKRLKVSPAKQKDLLFPPDQSQMDGSMFIPPVLQDAPFQFVPAPPPPHYASLHHIAAPQPTMFQAPPPLPVFVPMNYNSAPVTPVEVRSPVSYTSTNQPSGLSGGYTPPPPFMSAPY